MKQRKPKRLLDLHTIHLNAKCTECIVDDHTHLRVALGWQGRIIHLLFRDADPEYLCGMHKCILCARALVAIDDHALIALESTKVVPRHIDKPTHADSRLPFAIANAEWPACTASVNGLAAAGLAAAGPTAPALGAAVLTAAVLAAAVLAAAGLAAASLAAAGLAAALAEAPLAAAAGPCRWSVFGRSRHRHFDLQLLECVTKALSPLTLGWCCFLDDAVAVNPLNLAVAAFTSAVSAMARMDDQKEPLADTLDLELDLARHCSWMFSYFCFQPFLEVGVNESQISCCSFFALHRGHAIVTSTCPHGIRE